MYSQILVVCDGIDVILKAMPIYKTIEIRDEKNKSVSDSDSSSESCLDLLLILYRTRVHYRIAIIQ